MKRNEIVAGLRRRMKERKNSRAQLVTGPAKATNLYTSAAQEDTGTCILGEKIFTLRMHLQKYFA
jgi:hypothetical protein